MKHDEKYIESPQAKKLNKDILRNAVQNVLYVNIIRTKYQVLAH